MLKIMFVYFPHASSIMFLNHRRQLKCVQSIRRRERHIWHKTTWGHIHNNTHEHAFFILNSWPTIWFNVDITRSLIWVSYWTIQPLSVGYCQLSIGNNSKRQRHTGRHLVGERCHLYIIIAYLQ